MTAPRQEAGFQERLGERLKVLREKAGMSQRALAERMAEAGFGWHHSTVMRTERSQRSLRLDEAVMLANLLGVDIQDLYQAVNPMRGALAAAVYQARESQKRLEQLEELLRSEEDDIASARSRHAATKNAVANLERAIRQKERELHELRGRRDAAQAAVSASAEEIEAMEQSRRQTLEMIPVRQYLADRYAEHLNLVKLMRRNQASEDQFPPLPSEQDLITEYVALKRARESNLTIDEYAKIAGITREELENASRNDIFFERLLEALEHKGS